MGLPVLPDSVFVIDRCERTAEGAVAHVRFRRRSLAYLGWFVRFVLAVARESGVSRWDPRLWWTIGVELGRAVLGC